MSYKYIIMSILALSISLSSQAQSLKELLEAEAEFVNGSTEDKKDKKEEKSEKTDKNDKDVKEAGKEDSKAAPIQKVTTVEMDLLYQAVSPTLKVVKQQYRLKKDADYFGKNKMKHFGESLSLAAKVSGGTILQNAVMKPWANDNDYREANPSGKYTPVLYKSLQKPLSGGDFETVDYELESQYVKPVGQDSLLYLHSDKYSDFGLMMDTTDGEKSGYILWVYKTEDGFSHDIESFTIKAKCEETVIPMEVSGYKDFIGGVFVVPIYDRPGVLSFKLCGVASYYKTGEWYLKLLAKNERTVNVIN